MLQALQVQALPRRRSFLAWLLPRVLARVGPRVAARVAHGLVLLLLVFHLSSPRLLCTNMLLPLPLLPVAL